MGPIFSVWRIPGVEPVAPALARGVRALSLWLAVLFAIAGGSNVVGILSTVELFQRFGLAWAREPVGIAELGVSMLLLGARTRRWGAMGALLLLGGATVAHAVTGVLLPMACLTGFLAVSAAWLVVKLPPGLLRP